MALFKKKKEKIVEREDGLTDYDIYIMDKTEKIMYIILASVVLFGIGYVFYKNIVLSLLLMILSIKFPKIRTEQIIYKRKKDLTIQFKEMLYSLSSSLTAGRSVEMGLKECLKDLRIMYPDEKTMIILELTYIIHGIEMNETVEYMLQQFSERSHIEDIENFTDIFKTCIKTGGDKNNVIRSTSQTIGEKIEIKQEIETMISGKKYEFNFLMVMPIFLILMLTYTSGGYMDPVFETVIGNIVMTIAIGIFIGAYSVGSKIMKIEV